MKKLATAALIAALGVSTHSHAQFGNILKQLEKNVKQLEQDQSADRRTAQPQGSAVAALGSGSQGNVTAPDSSLEEFVIDLQQRSLEKSKSTKELTPATNDALERKAFPGGRVCRMERLDLLSLIEEGFYQKDSARTKVDQLLTSLKNRAGMAGGATQAEAQQCIARVEYLRASIKTVVAKIQDELKQSQQSGDSAQLAQVQSKLKEYIESLLSKIAAEFDQQKKGGFRLEQKYFNSALIKPVIEKNRLSIKACDPYLYFEVTSLIESKFYIQPDKDPQQSKRATWSPTGPAFDHTKDCKVKYEAAVAGMADGIPSRVQALANDYLNSRLKRYNDLKAGKVPMENMGDYELLYQPQSGDALVKSPMLTPDAKIYSLSGVLVQADGDEWIFKAQDLGRVGVRTTVAIEQVGTSAYQERVVGRSEKLGMVDIGYFKVKKDPKSTIKADMRLNTAYELVGQYTDNYKLQPKNGGSALIPSFRLMYIQ